MQNRFNLVIKYDGTNGTKHIVSEGQDIYECLENMIDEIECFKLDFLKNNFETGGNTVFTSDAKTLYEQCNNIENDINTILGNEEV